MFLKYMSLPACRPACTAEYQYFDYSSAEFLASEIWHSKVPDLTGFVQIYGS